MKILVTGASGAIGKKLITNLKDLDFQIKVLVLPTEKDVFYNYGVEEVIGDLCNKESLRKAVQGIETVIHLAGLTHCHDEKKYFKVNLEGTKNLVDICENEAVKKFIFVSSRVANFAGGAYARSKKMTEEVVQKSELNWLILSPAEVYGMREGEAIARLIRMVKRNRFVPIIGRGDYKLSPVNIDDVVKVIISALNKDISQKKYIIAGPKEYSYVELVDILANKFNKKIIKIFVPIFLFKIAAFLCRIFKLDFIYADQIPRLLINKPSDISPARKDLDFKPKYFEENIK